MNKDEKRKTVVVVIVIIVMCTILGLYLNYAHQQTLEKRQIVRYALDLDWDISENYTMDTFTDREITSIYLVDWGHDWYEFGVCLIHNEHGWKDKTVHLRFNTDTEEYYIV